MITVTEFGGNYRIEVGAQPAQPVRPLSDLTPAERAKVADFLARSAELARLAADWPAEAASLDFDQAADLATPELAWWQPRDMTEDEYIEMLAEADDYQRRGYGL